MPGPRMRAAGVQNLLFQRGLPMRSGARVADGLTPAGRVPPGAGTAAMLTLFNLIVTSVNGRLACRAWIWTSISTSASASALAEARTTGPCAAERAGGLAGLSARRACGAKCEHPALWSRDKRFSPVRGELSMTSTCAR